MTSPLLSCLHRGGGYCARSEEDIVKFYRNQLWGNLNLWRLLPRKKNTSKTLVSRHHIPHQPKTTHRWLFTIFPKVDFFTCRWIRAIFVLTFSPSGENVNTNMALIHRQVKKRNIPFYIKNDMGPNDSLTDGRKSYDCDEKYHIQNWQEGALFSFTLRWKIVVSLVTFHHLVNI